MAATPDGRGYWLVTLAGQVFAFGDATFAGTSAARAAGARVHVGIVAAPGGYRLVESNGNVFRARRDRGRTCVSRAATPLVAAG